MVSDGGLLILLAPCTEGIGPHPWYVDYIGSDLDRLLEQMETGEPEDVTACGLATQISRMKSRIRFGLVSPGLSWADADRLGFAYFESVEEGIAAELDRSVGATAVGVLTHAGLTVPLIDN
jgi:hypothetical protein